MADNGRELPGACGRIRELLSAYLDGEADPAETALVQDHLAGCAACRAFRRRAEELTRAVRLAPAAAGTDVATAAIAAFRPRRIDVLRGPAGARTRAVARIALGVVCGLQVLIGVLCLTGEDAMRHSMPGMTHLDHESAAWNIALIAGLGWVAARPRKGIGVLPLLGVFVAALTGLCIADLADGQVGYERVAMHVPAVLGLVLSAIVVALHSGPVLPPGSGARAGTGTAVLPAADEPDAPADTTAHPPVARRAAS